MSLSRYFCFFKRNKNNPVAPEPISVIPQETPSHNGLNVFFSQELKEGVDESVQHVVQKNDLKASTLYSQEECLFENGRAQFTFNDSDQDDDSCIYDEEDDNFSPTSEQRIYIGTPRNNDDDLLYRTYSPRERAYLLSQTRSDLVVVIPNDTMAQIKRHENEVSGYKTTAKWYNHVGVP